MANTRGQIKYEVLTRLNKTSVTQGFYTDEKLNTALQEAMDYVATEMFLADEGWMHKIDYVTTVANQVTVPIAPHWNMLAELRYLVGTIYTPIMYDQQYGEAQWAGNSGVIQYPYRYKIVDNQIYFQPPLGVGGTQFLQVEYFSYPKILQNDADTLDSQFDRCMYWFLVYDMVKSLQGGLNQTADDSDRKVTQWYTRLKDMIGMRTRQSIPIRDFDGYF
jgi:hypothetical protein